jgi:hypothetical protein
MRRKRRCMGMGGHSPKEMAWASRHGGAVVMELIVLVGDGHHDCVTVLVVAFLTVHPHGG